jgi:hypothetical protein
MLSINSLNPKSILIVLQISFPCLIDLSKATEGAGVMVMVRGSYLLIISQIKKIFKNIIKNIKINIKTKIIN